MDPVHGPGPWARSMIRGFMDSMDPVHILMDPVHVLYFPIRMSKQIYTQTKLFLCVFVLGLNNTSYKPHNVWMH